MYDGPPFELLERTFDGPVRDVLVRCLQRAYDDAAERHDPSIGSNELTFGVSAYVYAVFQISHAPEVEEGLIEIESRTPTFRARTGEFEFACHRVRLGDIWSSFPGNNGAIGEMIEGSLWLPGLDPRFDPSFEPGPEIERARKVVIAHAGDPHDGLQAVHVCIPRHCKPSGQIDEWAYVKTIWQREPAVDLERGSEEHPEEQLEDIPVRRRRQSEHGDGG